MTLFFVLVVLSASTVIVAINARLLRLKARPEGKVEPKSEARALPKAETRLDLTPQIATPR